MHEHDLDTIMALAEGSLDPGAAARAEETIAACDDCRADLELQRLALEALHAAPKVYLTAVESASLHDRLREELRVAPAVPARTRLRPMWGRWAALAAGTAAVFLAAFLVLPGLLGGGGDTETVAFEQVADDPSGAGDGERMATTDAAAEAPMAAAQTDDAADMGVAQEEAAPAEVAGGGAEGGYLVEGALTEGLRLQIAEQLRTDPDYFTSSSAEIIESAPGWLVCSPEVFGLDYAGLSYTPQLVGRIVDDLGQERLLVALVDNEDATEVALMSITVPGCDVFETLP